MVVTASRCGCQRQGDEGADAGGAAELNAPAGTNQPCLSYHCGRDHAGICFLCTHGCLSRQAASRTGRISPRVISNAVVEQQARPRRVRGRQPFHAHQRLPSVVFKLKTALHGAVGLLARCAASLRCEQSIHYRRPPVNVCFTRICITGTVPLARTPRIVPGAQSSFAFCGVTSPRLTAASRQKPCLV